MNHEISPYIPAEVEKDLFVVVDDFMWVRRLAKWNLEIAFGSNIRVELARDGAEAVSLFHQLVRDGYHRRINSIFMDCHMPELSGVDAIKIIRLIELLFHLKPVNVIGCSGDLDSALIQEFMDAGANATLAKPTGHGEMEALCFAV